MHFVRGFVERLQSAEVGHLLDYEQVLRDLATWTNSSSIQLFQFHPKKHFLTLVSSFWESSTAGEQPLDQIQEPLHIQAPEFTSNLLKQSCSSQTPIVHSSNIEIAVLLRAVVVESAGNTTNLQIPKNIGVFPLISCGVTIGALFLKDFNLERLDSIDLAARIFAIKVERIFEANYRRISSSSSSSLSSFFSQEDCLDVLDQIPIPIWLATVRGMLSRYGSTFFPLPPHQIANP